MNTQVSRKILYFLTVFSVTCFAAYEVWAQALFAMDSNSGPLTIAAQHTLAMTVDTAGGVTTTKPLVIAADATTTCSTAGAIRWNSTTKTHESCNGSQWTSPQYSAGANLAPNGYQKFANGLTIEWGSAPIATIAQNTQTIPIAFPLPFTQLYSFVFSNKIQDYGASSDYLMCGYTSLSASGAVIGCDHMGHHIDNAGGTINWTAIGYSTP